jgi:hypothetical protein
MIVAVGAVLPASAGHLVGPAGAVQPLTQVSEGFIWDRIVKGVGSIGIIRIAAFQ